MSQGKKTISFVVDPDNLVALQAIQDSSDYPLTMTSIVNSLLRTALEAQKEVTQ